jgi:hypothetical protein
VGISEACIAFPLGFSVGFTCKEQGAGQCGVCVLGLRVELLLLAIFFVGRRQRGSEPVTRRLRHVRCLPRGTPKYYAPEVARALLDSSSVDLTQAADVYTYGVILIKLFCGKVTWATVTGPDGKWSKPRIRANQDTAQPLLEPLKALHLPAGLVLLVEQCTRWRPEDRPTFATVVDKLKGLRAALLVAATPPSRFPSAEGPHLT